METEDRDDFIMPDKKDKQIHVCKHCNRLFICSEWCDRPKSNKLDICECDNCIPPDEETCDTKYISLWKQQTNTLIV